MKGRNDVALKLAKHAVNNTPSEFLTWAKLTDCYIGLGDYESVSIRTYVQIKDANGLDIGIANIELLSNVYL